MVTDFCRHYGLRFRDPGLVKLALTHRSYLHVTGQRESNERLEFLGDSVLGLVTSEYLYRAHPNEHEGQLTKTKSLLVSKAILSRRALAMGLGRFVLMSHSEVESGGRQRLSILADAFEAVVGAIYLDQGFEAARAFIERWLLRDTRSIVTDKRHTNYKSHLQEYVQSTYRTHPVYRIRSEVGPDHSKQFMVEVIVGKRTLGEGKGRNKKEAEQAAARNALERVERGPVSDRGMRQAARAAEPTRRPAPEPKGRASGVKVGGEEVAPSGLPAPGSAAEEREVLSRRRRRRGRRGGRGRRRPEAATGGAPIIEGETSARPAAQAEERPGRPAPAPRPRRERRAMDESRASRPAEREPPPRRQAEREPPPRRQEEDENEEVGRPEGPREEAHVDPYAWEGQEPGGERQAGPAPEGGAGEPEAAFEVEDVEDFEEMEPPAAPEPPEETRGDQASRTPGGPSAPPAVYGRRPRR